MRPPSQRGAVLVVLAVLAVLGLGGVMTGLWTELFVRGPEPFRASAVLVPWDEAIPAPSFSARPTPEPTFDLGRHSWTDPASPWVIVNKQHPIAESFDPDDVVDVAGTRVREIARPDLEAMIAAAQADGVKLVMRSGYRSYGEQAAARSSVEARRGFAHAERYSARPGYSEHETGLAVDVDSASNPDCNLQTCFTRTAEGVWLTEHAWEFGFVVRYTEANTEITGYAPEGWHLRWVGRDLTGWMHTEGVTSLEEAFDVPGGSEYLAR